MTLRPLRFFASSGLRQAALRGCILLMILLPSRAFGDVVVVKSSDADPYTQAATTFSQNLSTPGDPVRTVLVKELAESGIASAISTTDTVVAIGTPAASWLHNQLPEGIELVYCMVTNAQDSGLLKGTECWGVTTEVAMREQIDLMREALPKARNVGVLYRSDAPASVAALKELTDAVPADWHIEPVAANEHASVAEAIDALTSKQVDIIWTAANLKVYDVAAVRALLLSALRSKTPVWGFSPAFVRAGALIGVGVDPTAQAQQTVDLIRKLKTDKKSVKEHHQAAAQYQIAINLIVAQQIEVVLPDSLVKRATFVFKEEN